MAYAAPAKDESRLATDKPWGGVSLEEHRKSLNWLGIGLFVFLMAYPFIVHYVPSGIREYLAASLK